MDDGEPADFDALAPETFDSVYPLYADLRHRCPVARADGWGGFWALTTYDDVFRAAADFKTFTTTVQNVVPKIAFTGRRPPLHLDPPEHTPYRRALNPLLSEERAAQLEPATRRFADELLAPMLAKGGGDICDEFSARLPIAVFAEWMQLPPAMVAALRTTAKAFNLAVQSAMDQVVKQTSLELYDLARELIALRKAEPADPERDPTAALLAARDAEGAPLPDDMIIGCVRQVLVVGIIAPTVVIGSFAVHLARDPVLQNRLRSDPSLIPAAMEELLRLYTPYRGFARTPTEDVTIRGRTIRMAEPIALVYASANRDEAVFPDPDEFKLGRPNINDHLAFGVGPHRCAGVHLARMELRVMLEALLLQTPGFALAGEIRATRCPEVGALSVPLRFRPVG
jgi:cytochrome P450